MDSLIGDKVYETILDRVEDGNFGDCSPVGSGVHELKIHIGPGYRVYFGQDGDFVILLNGGKKATQDRDIKTAKQFWDEYNA
jgi:putative addiction module killer protein